jgi:hypothetical protein
MDTTSLAPWRDLAIVLLAFEIAVITAVPGVALVYAVRGVRALKRWLHMPLLNAQVWALRIQRATTRASDAVVSLPIALHSARARARVTVRGVIDFLRGY